MIKIVALNSKYVHTLLAPYYLKENCVGENIIIYQTNINLPIDQIAESILRDMPQIVAFSCYIFNISVVLELSKLIKEKLPQTVIIYGGPEVSFDPEQYQYADYVICGEGEIAFNNLIQSIMSNEHLDKKVVGELASLECIKSPYTEEYFSHASGKIAYFEASRGCPYNCSYCMSGKSKLRQFPLDYVKCELAKFEGKDIRVVKFVDRTFNADKVFAYAILRYILLSPNLHSLSFHFEIAGDLIDDELLCILSESPKGLFQFEIGVQSFNQQTLSKVIRKCDIDKLKENILSLVSLKKCHIHTDLIAGLPYEDLQSLRDSFNQLYALGGDMLQLGFLKLLKGSGLRREIEQIGGYIFNNTPPYEIISTPWISFSELDEVRLVEDAIDGYYNSGSFITTLIRFCSKDAYSFYYGLGKIQGDKQLFSRYNAISDYLILQGEDIEEVRSYLLYDYVSSNNSRTLPPSLKRYDKTFKKKLIAMSIDVKRFFCVQIGINTNNGNIEDGVLIIDYTSLPYKCEWRKL